MMLSLNHAIADGYTMYAIRNMLHPNAPVVSIDFSPCEEAVLKGEQLCGSRKNASQTDPIVGLLAALRGHFREDKPKLIVKYANQAWIDAQKILWRDSEVSFVSTNDVLVSWYMNIMNVQYGWMAINWRNRITPLDDSCAGNFQGVLTYWSDECSTPAEIRKSLTRNPDGGFIFGGSRDQPPTYRQRWSMDGGGHSGVTNWFHELVHIL